MSTTALPATGSPNLALMLANLVRNLRSTTPKQAIDDLFNFYTTKLPISQFVPATHLCPAYYVGDSGIDAIVLVDGTSNIFQATGLVAGYVGGPLDSITEPVNDFVRAAGDGVAGTVAGMNIPFTRRLLFAGWSLGGAVCEACSQELNSRASIFASTGVLSFGAPRWTGSGIANGMRGRASNWRLMNTGDPIPILPPTSLDTPFVIAMFGIRGAQRASNFYFSPGGTIMDADGLFAHGFTPNDATPNFTASLGDWLMSQEGSPGNAHDITTYINRLQLAVARLDASHATGVSDVQGSQVQRTRVEPRGGGTRGELTVAERRSLGVVLNLQRQQNLTPVTIPPAKRFKAFRVGRLWFVFFGDTQITICANKKSARRFARVGNAFLENVQDKPVIDPDAIVSAFQSYLAAAEDPAAGFVPVLNTVMPPA